MDDPRVLEIMQYGYPREVYNQMLDEYKECDCGEEIDIEEETCEDCSYESRYEENI